MLMYSNLQCIAEIKARLISATLAFEMVHNSTKNHLSTSPAEHKKRPRHMTLKIMVPCLGQAQQCGGFMPVYGITTIHHDNWISDSVKGFTQFYADVFKSPMHS
jgi:NADH:ubiquinone oxidoreductase subunit E